jgi:enediyne biosynthesis protein E4
MTMNISKKTGINKLLGYTTVAVFLCLQHIVLSMAQINVKKFTYNELKDTKEAKASEEKTKTIQFTDIASRSNFSYQTNNNFTGRKYFPITMCGGVAVFDFDNDDKLDIFFSNGAKLPELKKTNSSFHNCLLRNKGDGTFEDVTSKAGLLGIETGYNFGVAAADYDNDGFQDLFIANAGTNTLYHNNGDGTFSNVTTTSGLESKPQEVLSVGGAWVDYNNDGLLDLVVSNYTFWNPETDPICTIENGTIEIYCHPTNFKSVAHRLYRNLGKGKFSDVTDQSGFASAAGKGMGIGIADFNGDKAIDIFIANDTVRNFLFINQKHNAFKEMGILYGVSYNDEGKAVSAMGCDVKDFNNDGWEDVFYNDLSKEIFGLFQNEEGKFFKYVSPTTNIDKISRAFSGWSCGFIDYNNDGWKDIYSSNGEVDPVVPGAEQRDTMFENIQGKSFIDVSENIGKDFLPKGFQRGAAFGDINNDGSIDLVVTSLNKKPRILLNSGSKKNHWIIIETQGQSSNRDGIGAKIKVTTSSGHSLYNHVTTSIGFMSSSDKRVHFGLGAEKTIKSVEILWPSGTIQTLNNVKANQILKVKEPSK